MSVARRFNENRKHFKNTEGQEEKRSSSYFEFIHWLALRSCSVYKNGFGHIYSNHPTKVDFMFNKKIKLLVPNHAHEIFLVTEKGEEHYWDNTDPLEKSIINYYPHKMDWSKEYIVKTATNTINFLTLTNVGKIYYKGICDKKSFQSINEINIKGNITCIGCGINFFVVATDYGKTYSWGNNFYGQLGRRWSDPKCTTSQYFTVMPVLQACEVTKLSGKTIVKVVCGKCHTLALTDKGKVYVWGLNFNRQSNLNSKDNVFTPILVNIANVRKVSDIATMSQTSFVKSSKDGLVYMWGCLVRLSIRKPAVCEHTNVFDVCNSMMAQSPISMATSDLVIKIGKQFISVHKAILKIRCQYFRKMLQFHNIENDEGVIEISYYSYVVYKSFIQYLYTGTINLASLKDLLNLLILADEYCEKNLERDCIRIIKNKITISNVFVINDVAKQINKKELEEYCFDFFLKNKTDVMQAEDFTKLDIDTKIMFITKANKFFTSSF